MPSKKATSPDPGRLRWEGVVFNLICGGYFLFLSPLVISTVRSGLGDDTGEVAPAFWLGILLLLAMGAEIWALPEKLKFVRTAMRQRNPEMEVNTGLIFLWIFHATVTIILLGIAARELGADVFTKGKEHSLPGWFLTLIILSVLKELYLLLAMWGMFDGKEIDPRYVRPKQREWICDILLILYACLAYSSTWGMVSETSLERSNPVMFVINIFTSSLLFLIFYLPMRIPYLQEEWSEMKRPGQFFRWLVSLLMAVVPAVWSLP